MSAYDYFVPTTRAGEGYGQPGGVLDPWQAIISQSIEAARDVARGATSEYPYTSPDDPWGRRPIDVSIYPPPPAPAPEYYPLPPPPFAPQAPPREGIQLSQTTLMLLVGGVLLFMLGGKRGR